jgi:hypothetical protein
MNQVINEKLSAIRAQLTEASEIELSELDKPHQDYVAAIERSIRNCKFSQAWDGVHGVILNFDVKASPGGAPSFRMTKDSVEIINAFSAFRWLEMGKDELVIGC